MFSAVDVAVIKSAVEVCNLPDIKRKIICDMDEESDHKQQLNRILKEKELTVNSYLGLPNVLQEKVMSTVFSVGMRMLNWAIYHKSTVELPREYTVNFLNSSFFTHRGIIDSKRAAEELMKRQELSNIQKYKIACIYCFTDYISVLFREISNEEKETLYHPFVPLQKFYCPQQKIVSFWSYYLMDDVYKLFEGKDIDQYRLETAVKSGSVAAVQYCLEKTNLRCVADALVDAAEEAVRNKTLQITLDWIAYKSLSVKTKCLWVPGEYYNDILFFAFSKMNENQQITFLKKDIEGLKYEMYLEHPTRCRTLECFLNWPYQNCFMQTARLLWDILPENNFAILVLKICDKIESEDEYGEQKTFDYIKLLKEFWSQSPERYKRYFLSNPKVIYKNNPVVMVETCLQLLCTLISLNKITDKYRKNIELILDTKPSEEMENIIYSEKWINICMQVIRKEKWKSLDEFVLYRFFTETQANRFKKELINMKQARNVLIDFVKNDKWDTVELILKWSDLTDEEITQIKRELLYSQQGMRRCKDFIFYEGRIESASKFCEWGLSSEENIRQFKNSLIASELLLAECSALVSKSKLQYVDKFINWCLSDQNSITEFKNKIVMEEGYNICKALIIGDEKELSRVQTGILNHVPSKQEHSVWDEIETFLSWGLSSGIEYNRFKKGLFKNCGEEIHFYLISANKCDKALKFFYFLDLSVEEVQEFKMKTLLSSSGMKRFHKYLHDIDSDDEWAIMSIALNWCLQNEEAVLEFKSKYDKDYGLKRYESKGETIPYNEEIIQNKFESLIQKLICTLGGKVERTKRKMETMEESPRKTFPRV